MSFSLVPAQRRIATTVTTAAVETRRRLKGTTWVKTISTPTTALKVTIVYATTRSRMSLPEPPRWEVRYTSATVNWTLKPGVMGPLVEGEVPRQLPNDFWDDLHAILPKVR